MGWDYSSVGERPEEGLGFNHNDGKRNPLLFHMGYLMSKGTRVRFFFKAFEEKTFVSQYLVFLKIVCSSNFSFEVAPLTF